ncbi:MAG: asparagine synthase (glutamine-hydrolyzing) [Proteobacteria bacterium]|nr:asparagine synthase (glutamine-hydrolyzing) [Pseudomonadota bacterium]
MCGIAGIWSPQARPDEGLLRRMIGALHHRGPDGQGLLVDGPVGLAHARLAIIDPGGGAQPIANEDGSVQVVFNGEIFNYVELRRELLQRGHRFATQSDTEVLVHLYEEHGSDFLQHLNGQFAIALWDARQRRLLLARDRAGIRPLYYAHDGASLLFASEVKALFASQHLARRLDPTGLSGVFAWWSAVAPRTVFEGVRALPPGCLMLVDEQGTRVTRWWDWNFPVEDAFAPVDEEALAEELHALLIDAVKLQLRADVPVGAYLSGGLDSSIVTSIIARHTDTPLRSFSLTFEDAEFDESEHQRVLASHLSTRHSSIACRRGDIAAAFARTVWHAETPIVRAAPAPMMLLADSVRAAGYKVVLTGEGADEVFGGYDLFKEAKVRRFIARQPGSAWRRRIIERLYPYLAVSPTAGRGFSQQFFAQGLDRLDDPAFAHLTRLSTTGRARMFFTPEWQQRMAEADAEAQWRDRLPDEFEQWLPMARDQYTESHTLMGGYLLSSQGDRMAMAASIEGRFPFLDHRVMEFAARLPPRLKIRGLREKLLLKKAFARELPAQITQRTKQPYRVPDSASFFEAGRPLPWVAELLEAGRVRDAGLLDPTAVGKLVAKCAAGRAIGFGDNMAFVGVLSTMLLHEQFLRHDSPRAP